MIDLLFGKKMPFIFLNKQPTIVLYKVLLKQLYICVYVKALHLKAQLY